MAQMETNSVYRISHWWTSYTKHFPSAQMDCWTALWMFFNPFSLGQFIFKIFVINTFKSNSYELSHQEKEGMVVATQLSETAAKCKSICVCGNTCRWANICSFPNTNKVFNLQTCKVVTKRNVKFEDICHRNFANVFLGDCVTGNKRLEAVVKEASCTQAGSRSLWLQSNGRERSLQSRTKCWL